MCKMCGYANVVMVVKVVLVIEVKIGTSAYLHICTSDIVQLKVKMHRISAHPHICTLTHWHICTFTCIFAHSIINTYAQRIF
jgi:hypothetical protein